MRTLFFCLIFVALLPSCATLSDGFYIQRSENLYDLQVGLNLQDPETGFYRGAYELCKDLHKTGFEVKAKNWERRAITNNDSVRGTIECKGKVASFLTKKFGAYPVKLVAESSNLGFLSGKKFRLVPIKK